MNNTMPRIPEEYVVPLNMNGLRGRMLRMPAKKKTKNREILLIYGHHSSLERMYSVAEVLNDYGAVTLPDLPGFGGMDSFYKIGERPDMDTMADYLASFIKLRYRNRRITIAAISYGFTIITRMLQKYPEISKKVDLLVSIVGFAHHEDFIFSQRRLAFYRNGARLFSYRLPAMFFKNVVLHPAVLRTFYAKTHNAKHKFAGLNPEEAKTLTEFEVHLWRINDVRTYMATTVQFLKLNNCNKQVDLPVWHVGTKEDNYFDSDLVEQHMRVIFKDFIFVKAPFDKHMPNVIAGKKEVSGLIPRKIRTELNKKS